VAGRPLLICGTGVFAVEVADVASEVSGLRLDAFVENLDRERAGRELDGMPIVWVDDVARLAATHVAVCAIGTTLRSRFTRQVEELGVPFTALVHPTARISTRSTLGDGTIASVGVAVAAETQVGRHVILNRGVLVGHHTTIGDHVTLGPGANVAGKCRIGAGAYVAMGALVLDRVSVGADAVVAAGAVVTRDVPPRGVAVGMPARVIKYREMRASQDTQPSSGSSPEATAKLAPNVPRDSAGRPAGSEPDSSSRPATHDKPSGERGEERSE
jgi:sugar O-acyltransferase (sialic acid O-acetyltransferase NeuD family)